MFVNDAGFYWTHRMLHHPSLYARFHKQHHEYKGTIGFAAEYATPFEAFFSNHLPMIVPVCATAMHPLVWLVFRLKPQKTSVAMVPDLSFTLKIRRVT